MPIKLTHRDTYRYLVVFLLVVAGLQLNAQTFSYGTICADAGTIAPLPPALPSGGTFSATAGLTIDPTTGVITGSTSATGSYVVSYYGSSCNCVYHATVNVYPTPVISVNNTVCASGSNAVLTASPTSGNTYTWLPIGSNGNVLTVPVSSPIKNFTLLSTAPNGCKTSKAFSLTIVGATPLQIVGPFSVCAGQTTTFTASGAISYSWSTGSTSSLQVLTPTTSITFTLTNMDAPQCNLKVTRNLTVQQTVSLSLPNYSVCSGSSVVLRANASTVNNVKFTWLPSSQSTADTLLIQPNASITYTLFATRAGCASSITSQVTVITSTIPNVLFNYKSPMCVLSIDSLPLLSPDFKGGGKFIGLDGLVVDSVTGVFSAVSLLPGNYQVTYTLAQKGCVLGQSNTVPVQISYPANLTITGNTLVPYGSPSSLIASGSDLYVWGPETELSCVTCAETIVTPTASREYCVETYAGGCPTRKCIKVEIYCSDGSELTVPSAFTPNSDGKNERFCLQGWKSCNTFFEFNVFDKWGTLVYSVSTPDFCWDGKYNGDLLPAGVYAYVLTASFNHQPKIAKSGSISLIR